MSNQDDERMALKPSPYANTPSINDGKDTRKLEPDIVGDDDGGREEKSTEPNTETNNENDSDSVATTTDVDHQVIRSESVIRSPSKSIISSPTPVIQVVDTSSQNLNSESLSNNNNNNNNESTKKSHVVDPCKTVNVASQASSSSQSSQQPTSAANYFLQPAHIAPNNPFLRAASFQSASNSSDNSSNSESNSESEIVFAPPKLIPSSFSNKYETKNFLHPSILKTSDSGIGGDLKKPSETISASKTFISLNKEDIGTIKTPSFIKNTSLNISNGNTVPLGEDVKDPETITERPKSTFLFGQKLENRVVFDSKTHINNDLKSESSKIDHLISFSDVTKCEETINNPTNDLILADNEMECTSSSSSAALVGLIKNGDNCESVFKRKYEVITGEEDEQNVLTIYGKLYAWDTEKKSWVEKGRGHLRLNDVMKNDKLCSRLVMRTAGALRLILNAHIVFGMTFELANENCLRFTYVDGIYLIKANPKDIDQLHSAIEHRLRELSWKRPKASSVVENKEDE